MAIYKKIKCPYCGSERIAEYLYGLYGYDDKLMKAVEEGEVILAGCIITPNDPDYRCRDCNKDFGANINTMFVSDEEVLKFAKENGFEGIKYEGAYRGNHAYQALSTIAPNTVAEKDIPQYILVKGDEIELADEENRDIMWCFYSEDDEDDEDEV